MNQILVLIIVFALAYAVGFRFGVLRGKRESRMKEFRRGYQAGFDQARENFLLKGRELSRTAEE
jgi:hypothetical protein